MRIDFTSIPVAPGMRPGSTRQAIAGSMVSAVRVVTAKDAIFDGSLHRHVNEQVVIVVSGSVTIACDDERYVLEAGEMAFFPSGSKHGAVGIGSEGAVYYEVFAPARLDQLPGYLGPSALERE